ncbi:hypothetical protein [Faecalicoccus pleomorphus]|uniref:hypothetical protein n=1 Tax=Faecalicoccus pleomorphus TaxID=1323 RepID=UPI00189B6F2C|nr:hypothetical protein [Faecalicoccus pleomorphus]MDB7985235.1 hypothetical protein [Faecalicoccus pleomorphus]
MKLILNGCSNPGLSYTEKYKMDIIRLYDYFLNLCPKEIYEYTKLQDLIEDQINIDGSEIRMVIPFLFKIGILSEENAIRGGKKLRKIIINDSLFTKEGLCFAQFLKIDKNKNSFNDVQKEIVDRIFHKFGLMQFEKLRNGENLIYDDLLVFLKKYKTIDKNEFFILTDSRKENKLNLLEDLVQKYRNHEVDGIEIKHDPNAFQYVTKLLLQLGILKKNQEGFLVLTNLANMYFKEDNYEFKQ